MDKWKIRQSIDLAYGGRGPNVWPEALMVVGDRQAHVWEIEIRSAGDPADLSDATVTAYFNRSDNVTVPIKGSILGNVASVILDQQCYAVVGPMVGVFRLTSADGITMTLSVTRFNVGQGPYSQIIDSGNVIPNIDDLLAHLDAMDRITQTALKIQNAQGGPVDLILVQGDPGYTPVRGKDYWTADDQEAITEEVSNQLSLEIADELAKRGQLKPEFANSITDCTDTSKLYVLPDGYLYAYKMSEGEQFAIEITGETGGYYNGDDYYPTGTFVPIADTSGKKTNIIPITPGDKFSYTGFGSSAVYSVFWLDSSQALISREQYDARTNAVELTAPDGAAYVWFNSFYYSASLDRVVLSVSWVLCQAAVREYRWVNTGHAFVPADYEDRIVALEKAVEDTDDIPFVPGVLYGKKYVACGDSFTAGPFSAKTEETWDSDMGVYKTYPYWIAKRNQMTLVNEAQSGSDFTNINGAVNAFSVNRYLAVPADADYITLMFGLNETGVGADRALIGTKDDTTNATLWGAYNIVFEHFLTNMPFAKIGVIIADAWMPENYASAVREICKYWGIPFLDLKSDDVPMGIGGRYSATSSKARSLRNAAFQVSSSDSHPNPKAHAYRSTIIENFLRSL